MKIKPGRAAVQLPHAGRDASFPHGFGGTGRCQSPVGAIPYAKPFRVDFAIATATAATGAVAGVFGATGLGAEKTHMLYGTVPATFAVQ